MALSSFQRNGENVFFNQTLFIPQKESGLVPIKSDAIGNIFRKCIPCPTAETDITICYSFLLTELTMNDVYSVVLF